MLRIIPRASNAFDVELLGRDGKVVGRLSFSSYKEELYVKNDNGEVKVKSRSIIQNIDEEDILIRNSITLMAKDEKK